LRNYKIRRRIKHLACINYPVVNALDALLHLLGFAAPALAVALAVASGARWLLPRTPQSPGWRVSFAIDFIAGLAVLGAGLWYFGRDGKMATYAALVVVVATVQWLSGRAWRG
jgi:hypothetical protein